MCIQIKFQANFFSKGRFFRPFFLSYCSVTALKTWSFWRLSFFDRTYYSKVIRCM